MFPTLLEYGSFQLHSFGVFVALGFLAGVLWCYREAHRQGIDPDRILDLSLALFLTGILGARLLYVVVNWASFQAIYAEEAMRSGALKAAWLFFREAAAFWQGGMVWYGGLILAFLFGVLFLKQYKLPVWQTADLVAPGVMLGLAVGRLGCLAAGDDYGRVVDSAWSAVLAGGKPPWWTLTFRDPNSLVPDALLGIPLYPTQIMMALNALTIFLILSAMRKTKRFQGQVVWSMICLYGLGRMAIELYRGDEARGFVLGGPLSTSQFIGALSIAVSAGMMVYCAKTQRIALPAESQPV